MSSYASIGNMSHLNARIAHTPSARIVKGVVQKGVVSGYHNPAPYFDMNVPLGRGLGHFTNHYYRSSRG